MRKAEAARAAAAVAATTGGSSSNNMASSSTANIKPSKRALSKSPIMSRKMETAVSKGNISIASSPLGIGGGGGGGSGGGSTGSGVYGGTSSLSTSPTLGDEFSMINVTLEDSDCVDGGSGRENGSNEATLSTAHSDEGSLEGQGSDSGDTHKVRAAIEHLRAKIDRTKELIQQEQIQKETNVKEYLHLAAGADKQQNQRIKTVFEKRNQKSAQSMNHLQKKLEQYQRRLVEVETHGVTGHKQAKEVLRDVGQGLNTIVSKPKEFAHLLKNRFGSTDNIADLKEDDQVDDTESHLWGGGSIPVRYASFKLSDDENSSVTSGSGYGAQHSSPYSASRDVSQSLPVATLLELEPLREEMSIVRDSNQRVEDALLRLLEDFENYKGIVSSEVSILRGVLEEEKYQIERLQDQLHDLTELHQHQMDNLKQDTAALEEKIEYRLDERTNDLSDLVDNCQSRILRIEQQQQQQQLVSMEMVENVKFRTLLTKLINVVLAVLAVLLLFVSTAGNLLSPFVNTRKRILWTSALTLLVSVLWFYSFSVLHSLLDVAQTISSIIR